MMALKVTEVKKNRIVFDFKAMEMIPIRGLTPKVRGIVVVTPGMLKTMLEQPNLN